MKTNEKELRELDAWIAKNVMGWKKAPRLAALTTGDSFWHGSEDVFIQYAPNRLKQFHPTTDPAAAMEVLKKCGDKLLGSDTWMSPYRSVDGWIIDLICDPDANVKTWGVCAETLELAICRFAKKLFSQPTPTK